MLFIIKLEKYGRKSKNYNVFISFLLKFQKFQLKLYQQIDNKVDFVDFIHKTIHES